MTSEEWVDVVDEDDRVVGRVTRKQMRAQNLWHRVTAVMCFDPQGRIYVHRRTDHKDVYPGLHDMFCAGAVSAGESYDETAVRELGEELGIVGPTPEFMFKMRYADAYSRSHSAIYRVTWDGPIRHQPSEVAWGAFCTVQEIIENKHGWRFVPDGSAAFERWRTLFKVQ